MTSRKQDYGATTPSGTGPTEKAPADPSGKRQWSPPTITSFNLTETQGLSVGFSDDGLNNITNLP